MAIEKVIIPDYIVKKMRFLSKLARKEIAFYLIGTDFNNTIRIYDVVQMKYIENDVDHVISSSKRRHDIELGLPIGLHVVGHAHSHASETVPSKSDMKNFIRWESLTATTPIFMIYNNNELNIYEIINDEAYSVETITTDDRSLPKFDRKNYPFPFFMINGGANRPQMQTYFSEKISMLSSSYFTMNSVKNKKIGKSKETVVRGIPYIYFGTPPVTEKYDEKIKIIKKINRFMKEEDIMMMSKMYDEIIKDVIKAYE
ncbi:MAG: hypothetical protein ACTSRA_00590 [Promethearchaeota archaeon]